MQKTLSVVIITFNEERNIARCLNSIEGLADEIIVVDSHSTDKTEEICRNFGVRFFSRDWEGYAAAKNFGNAKAQSNYILSLDADEALSEELRNAIRGEKERGFSGAYAFNRLTNYCGQWIKHSGWYPDRKTRIWPTNRATWEGELVHEVLKIEQMPVKILKGDLLHYSYYSQEEHEKQIEKYTDFSARKAYNRGAKSSYFKIFYKTVFKFLRDYIFKLGFLDGSAGFTICRLSARAKYLKYAKLRKLNHEKARTA